MSQRAKTNKRVSEVPAKLSGKGQNVADGNTSCSSTDFSKMSVNELLNAVLERNNDPVIEQMIYALISKIPQEVSERIDTEKKERSLVIEWLPEPPTALPPSAKQRDLEDKISDP